MDYEVWQQLLSLENVEITKRWFSKIHGRELNAKRTREINAAAKQSREYFRNADQSDYSVRPLLTYYGVISLSRALLLLLKKDSGEESLTAGHGISPVNWKEQLSGDPMIALKSLGNLKVQISSGIFCDFIKVTKNRILIYDKSDEVDFRIDYNVPDMGIQISLKDLIARIPDLFKDFASFSPEIKYSYIYDLNFDDQKTFTGSIEKDHFELFKKTYENLGYKIEPQSDLSLLSCDSDTFEKNKPLFIHSYIQKRFGWKPDLFIAEPFQGKYAFSQLCITYMIAYILGMLARYYPTYWISLVQGNNGDGLWPTINRTQHFVENSYPELVV